MEANYKDLVGIIMFKKLYMLLASIMLFGATSLAAADGSLVGDLGAQEHVIAVTTSELLINFIENACSPSRIFPLTFSPRQEHEAIDAYAMKLLSEAAYMRGRFEDHCMPGGCLFTEQRRIMNEYIEAQLAGLHEHERTSAAHEAIRTRVARVMSRSLMLFLKKMINENSVLKEAFYASLPGLKITGVHPVFKALWAPDSGGIINSTELAERVTELNTFLLHERASQASYVCPALPLIPAVAIVVILHVGGWIEEYKIVSSNT